MNRREFWHEMAGEAYYATEKNWENKTDAWRQFIKDNGIEEPHKEYFFEMAFFDGHSFVIGCWDEHPKYRFNFQAFKDELPEEFWNDFPENETEWEFFGLESHIFHSGKYKNGSPLFLNIEIGECFIERFPFKIAEEYYQEMVSKIKEAILNNGWTISCEKEKNIAGKISKKVYEFKIINSYTNQGATYSVCFEKNWER